MAGPCEEKKSNWYFDAAAEECTAFSYGGCEGNANRFETEEQCLRQCGAFRDQVLTYSTSADRTCRHQMEV